MKMAGFQVESLNSLKIHTIQGSAVHREYCTHILHTYLIRENITSGTNSNYIRVFIEDFEGDRTVVGICRTHTHT